MFKLVALLFLASVVIAKPGAIFSPVITDEVIESHGNSVVHASAPVIQYPTVYSAPSILHGAPLAYSAYNQPFVYYK